MNKIGKTTRLGDLLLYKNEITLPLHTLLSDEDIEYIYESFRSIIEN